MIQLSRALVDVFGTGFESVLLREHKFLLGSEASSPQSRSMEPTIANSLPWLHASVGNRALNRDRPGVARNEHKQVGLRVFIRPPKLNLPMLR
jgi:hypothetical protein